MAQAQSTHAHRNMAMHLGLRTLSPLTTRLAPSWAPSWPATRRVLSSSAVSAVPAHEYERTGPRRRPARFPGVKARANFDRPCGAGVRHFLRPGACNPKRVFRAGGQRERNSALARPAGLVLSVPDRVIGAGSAYRRCMPVSTPDELIDVWISGSAVDGGIHVGWRYPRWMVLSTFDGVIHVGWRYPRWMALSTLDIGIHAG